MVVRNSATAPQADRTVAVLFSRDPTAVAGSVSATSLGKLTAVIRGVVHLVPTHPNHLYYTPEAYWWVGERKSPLPLHFALLPLDAPFGDSFAFWLHRAQ